MYLWGIKDNSFFLLNNYYWRKQYFENFQKNLDGYEFPVYSTERCPRNQTEWNERSFAISCNKTNGYVCLPNENITELLEFCYIYPFIWIQEGKEASSILNEYSFLCDTITQVIFFSFKCLNNSTKKLTLQ